MCKDKHPTRYVPQNKISLKLTLAHDIYTYALAYECTCIPHSTAIIPAAFAYLQGQIYIYVIPRFT